MDDVFKNKLKLTRSMLTRYENSYELIKRCNSEIDIVTVNELLKKVYNEESKIEAHFTQVEDCLDDDNFEQFEQIRCDIDNRFLHLKSKLRTLLNPSDRIPVLSAMVPINTEPIVGENIPIAPVASPSASVNTVNESNLPINDNTGPIKLPRLELPRFNGDWTKWYEFKNGFLGLLSKGGHLSEIQKYFYLKHSCVDRAADVISAILPDDNAYKNAWHLLEQAFDNKMFMIQRYQRKLADVEYIYTASPETLEKFANTVFSTVRVLNGLGKPFEDSSVLAMVTGKLDIKTQNKWYKIEGQSPTLEQFETFLRERIKLLHLQDEAQRNLDSQKKEVKKKISTKVESEHVFTRYKDCGLCMKEPHLLYKCEKFGKMTISERRNYVKNNKLCFLCLREGHSSKKCKLRIRCRTCKGLHNDLVHEEKDDKRVEKPVVSQAMISERAPAQVFLSTAVVQIADVYGDLHQARLLLDSGSQTSFITESLAKRLKLTRHHSSVMIIGINQQQGFVTDYVEAKIQSRVSNYNVIVEFYVLPSITDNIPSMKIDISNWKIPENVSLADPLFNIPNSVDLLLSNAVCMEVIGTDKIPSNVSTPTLLNSEFGWVIGGSINTSFTGITTTELAQKVDRLWEVENFENVRHYTTDEEECEQHYKDHVTRLESGRFSLALPFKLSPKLLGKSLEKAKIQFYCLERRFRANEPFAQQYKAFMNEYLELNHMAFVCLVKDFDEQQPHYFLPHHGVLKESTTTALRTVFNASAQTSTGYSLNDLLHIGPIIQETLFSITLRFRTKKIGIVADISKMYRQIEIRNEDRKYQLIVWRPSPTELLAVYALGTVTYGEASAPYQAVRTIRELAERERNRFDKASNAIEDYFVDDFISGGDTIEEVVELRNDMINMMKSGGFHLRKWASNEPKVLQGIPKEDLEPLSALHMQFNDAVKTLGLIWLVNTDTFRFNIILNNNMLTIKTKRSLLSVIASLYDPLGLLAPILIKTRIFFQQIWLLKLTWDENLTDELCEKWNNMQQDLHYIKELEVPRAVVPRQKIISSEIHIFSDASERAYGAVAYYRCILADNSVTVEILTAKSRVCPLKVLSIARLELCAAHLASQLSIAIRDSLKMQDLKIFAWCDSKIVLAWISSEPARWKIFVANRVAKIQRANLQWNFVSSKNNPADLISRGIYSKQLKQCDLWWHGPAFLHEVKISYDSNNIDLSDDVPEARSMKVVVSHIISTDHILNRYSSLDRLMRITGWCLRFINNIKKKDVNHNKDLSLEEVNTAMYVLIRVVQQSCYSEDISKLKKKGQVPKSSSLRQLTPFLDNNNLLRVGGRLHQASIDYNIKHPIIIPAKGNLTYLIIHSYHKLNLHSGIQLTLASIRSKYWIINGKEAIKKILRQCVICFKQKPKIVQPLMGSLPVERVQPSPAFTNIGIDFTGPIQIKPPTRSKIVLKCYIALFICLSTKAVHIELVSDLSTDAFILSLKRFTGRRGLPKTVRTDCGRNFIGAKREIEEYRMQLIKTANNKTVQEYYKGLGINWVFNSPKMPWAGGIWESAIKSLKYHLKRTVGSAHLTYEELNTLLINIEMCLNSRPITEMTNDPEDLNPLTPGHFVIGRAINTLAEAYEDNQGITSAKRWKRLQEIQQHFWKRWKKEYLPTLQMRSKWMVDKGIDLVGKLCIIHDEGTPPGCWLMGRIKRECKSKLDGITRVVEVKTANGMLTRPVARISILPVET